MKTAALAFAALYARDPQRLEGLMGHLTPVALQQLEDGWRNMEQEEDDNDNDMAEYHRVLAQATIRRVVHKCLDKYSSIAPPQVVEDALKYHILPIDLQQELIQTYGGGGGEDPAHPATWFDALQQLQTLAGDDPNHLWRLILEHPMTSYVPMQCQTCGHVVPDEFQHSGNSNDDVDDDAKVGLSELAPTGTELDLRAGWFRGPRSATVFQLECPESTCQATSQWYRSGHPQVILNPNQWGRLCGEQEDLRLALAQYLKISVRTCLPLDWDHVWSEFLAVGKNDGTTSATSSSTSSSSSSSRSWQVQDENARNFAVRLDEGIGAWTGIWAIHPDPKLCHDVTDEYLACQSSNKGEIGRAQDEHASNMSRYRHTVQKAGRDASGQSTQAGTVHGYVVQRAKLSSTDITRELQRAANEYGVRAWWQVQEEEEVEERSKEN